VVVEAPDFQLTHPKLWHYRAFILRVVDGDTVIAMVDRGFFNYTVKRLRLSGIDAPEMSPRSGTSAQRKAERVLAVAAKDRVIELIELQEVVIETRKTGKFDRWLATIFLAESSVNQKLLDEGHAVVYGQPRPWRSE